jgi:hypothetical protein
MGKTATIGHVVGLPVMHVLAARISKTAIPWRTRGPDDRRGQLRFVARVWPAIVNAVRQRGALMVSWMHSVTVGMAAIVNPVPPARCSHGVMDAQCYSRDGWR